MPTSPRLTASTIRLARSARSLMARPLSREANALSERSESKGRNAQVLLRDCAMFFVYTLVCAKGPSTSVVLAAGPDGPYRSIGVRFWR